MDTTEIISQLINFGILHPLEFLGLILASLSTSFITASLGIGGGTILLAVMANVMPINALIPVHGVVQLGSNFGRAALMIKHADFTNIIWFTIGSVLGSIIGGRIVITLPSQYLQLILGAFILYWIFKPKPLAQGLSKLKTISLGLISTLLTMFVGATGPFVLSKLKNNIPDPVSLVATFSSLMVVQHGLKVIIFGFLGFAFHDYLSLIVCMIAAGFIGTILGKKVLLKVNQEAFHRGLKIVLCILALRLIYLGVITLINS